MFSPIGVLLGNPDRQAALRLLTAQFLVPRWRLTRAGEERFRRLADYFEENPFEESGEDELHTFLGFFHEHEDWLGLVQFPLIGATLHDLVYACESVISLSKSQLKDDDPHELARVVSYYQTHRDRLPTLIAESMREGWIERDTRWETLDKEEADAIVKKHAVYVKK